MLIVQKYGGTSLGDATRIKKVAEHVVNSAKAENKVVVIVSAMASETDRLLKLGNSLISEGAKISEREMDALISTGEMASAALLALAIEGLGVPAVSLNASQIRIVTDSNHQRARMKYIETDKIFDELSHGRIVVITGFQGVTESGDITTIGRGGSDTSAVAVAAALKASACEIYSDVDGLFSSDPNVCPAAKKIDKVSYEEMLETAGAGAKVVHMHAVELAAKEGVTLQLKESPSVEKKAGSGTTVMREDINMDKVLVSTIAHTSNEAKISVRNVPDRIGIASKLFEPLADANINVDMIVQSVASDGTSDISFTIPKPDLKKAMQLTEIQARNIGAGKVEMAADVAKISIIGIGMRSHAGVAAKMFDALAKAGIDIQMISTSEIKVSVVVDSKFMEKAVNALHNAFIS
jgi:aspartate kinase